MKLLVFAATPPPVHGQNIMVAQLLTALKQDSRFTLFHVDPALSRTHAEIGRWHWGKILRLIAACFRALRVRLSNGPMVFYYVPAPGKRAALYRDWLVMALCRPFFSTLVFHWHGVGLGSWLQTSAHGFERGITRALLGRADLSIVLDDSLRADADELSPKRLTVVPNGIPDPNPSGESPPKAGQSLRCLFLGLCSAEKGLFDAMDAVELANTSPGNPVRVHLTIAGAFGNEDEKRRFFERTQKRPDCFHYVGSVSGAEKDRLFRDADLFCFPTHYPHEGQPLTVMEALAYDLPIIASRWRAVPAMLPANGIWLVQPGSVSSIALALEEAACRSWSPGGRRQHYLVHFTQEHHASALANALLGLVESSVSMETTSP